MSTQVLDPAQPCTVVSPAAVVDLLCAAHDAPLRRARLCLHEDSGDPLHEMIIAFWRGSYVAPHRHRGKSESFHVMQGEIEVVFFDDEGALTSRVVLSASDPARPRVYRLRQPLWHTVVVRSECAVIHEITNGPFRQEDTEIASWAPAPLDPAAMARFQSRLSSRSP